MPAPIDLPPHFACPISLTLMLDPVTLPSGITYDRPSIQKWLHDGNSTCPATMTLLAPNPELIPNHALRRIIQEWCVANRAHGVDRISTTRTPTPSAESRTVRLMLDDIVAGRDRLSSLRELRTLAKTSESNRRCIEAQDAVPVLAGLMDTDVPVLADQRETMDCLHEALGTLVLLRLEGTTGANGLMGEKQLRIVYWLLNRGTIDARVNAATLLKTLATNETTANAISTSHEAIDGLIGLLKEKLYHIAIKTTLDTLLALSRAPRDASNLVMVEKGAVPTLIELLPGAGRSTTERVLALIKALSTCAEGRAAIISHALAIPALVRSLLVVSAPANEHALGALWSVCLNSSRAQALEEAAQVGASEKLMVLAQMHSSPKTKQKTKELLRALSGMGCGITFHSSLRF